MTSHSRLRGIVGRRAELAELERVLASVRGGTTARLVIEGPEGIGKTALVDEFLADHRSEIRCLRATGLRWERELRFGVLEQLLARSGRSAPTTWPDSARAPADLGRKLLETCSEADEKQPVVIVVDDAHWADVASLEALSSALQHASGEQLLHLLTAEEQSQSAEAREVLGHRGGPVLRLGPLKPAAVRGLAIQWTGVDLSAPVARRLAEHTRGNPLHIKQLLHELPNETWSGWQPMLPAPKAFSADVRETMRSCTPETRAFVESAAVLGDSTSFAEAAQLADAPDPLTALDEACRSGLLTAADARTLGFTTPLVRAAVYGELPPLRRHQLHARAADIVESEWARFSHRVANTPFPDAELADELDRFAARQAALGAWSAAGHALVYASRLSPARADREHRALRAVDGFAGAGDLPQAATYSPAIESLPPTPRRDAVLGYLAIMQGRPVEAETLLNRAWQQCSPQQDPDTAALICQRRVLDSLSRLRGPDLVAWARRAIELVGPDEPSAVESAAVLGLGLAASGYPEQAKRAYREVLDKVEAGAQAQRFDMAKGWLDLALDDPLTARGELQRAVPTRYRMGSARISLWAQAWLARTEFALGAWDDAIYTVNRAVAELDSVGLDLVRPLVHWTGIQTHALRGNWDQAHAHLQEASAGTHNYEIMLIPSCLARAQYAEAQADYESVLRALEPVVHLPSRGGMNEPGHWPWHDVYGNALVLCNRVEEADAFLAPHEKLAAERGHRSVQARLGYVRGRLQGTTGDIEAARASFDRALNQLTGLPLPYDRARVNFAYGQTLRRAGKRREADVVLQNARDAYLALGANAYVERCDRELKAGGMNVKRGGGESTPLTAQEHAVAALVAAGKSNKQAAVELFISVKTIQFHLTRIYSKLGISSRSELAARFRDEPFDDKL
ncbi:helix-turn-helix transcriptional regulator [Parasphingorhabdus pacifica]